MNFGEEVSIQDNTVRCGVCGEVIFYDVRSHVDVGVLRLEDGRMKVISMNWRCILHLCDLEAMSKRVVDEATRALYRV